MDLQSNNFTLSFVNYEMVEGVQKKFYIPFSFYPGTQNGFGTYGEKITEKENNQFTLNFSMMLSFNDQPNIFIPYLVIDRELRLKTDTQTIDFIITNIVPKFTNKNISYTYTCQDAFSLQHSKQSSNISLSTDDESYWEDQAVGPRTINELANKILTLANSKWTIDTNLNNTLVHFPDNLYTGIDEMKVSYEATNTTPYNALVEVAKLFNASIKLDYTKNIIYFTNNDTVQYNGLHLRPETNLSAFSYSEKGDNLYNIMYVTGGEDAEGGYVSIVPSMPACLSSILIDTYVPKDLVINNDYYSNPSFYNDGNDIWVRYKNASTGNCKYKQIEPYQNNNTKYSWMSAQDNSELRNIILNYYYQLPEDEQSSVDIDSINNFFNELRFVPYAESFLSDFSYWKENGLLSEERYNNLLISLNIEYRNINLLYMAYAAQHNIINYELQRLVTREEELIAEIAAEDEHRAFIEEDNSDTIDSYYLTHAICVDDDYFIPIGILKENNIYYGKFDNNSNIYITLPDLENLCDNIQDFYILDVNSDKILDSIKWINYNTSLNTITTSSIYYNVLVYVKYADLQLLPKEFHSIVSSTDGVIDARISDLISQIKAVQNNSYIYMHQILYGGNWLNDRIADIRKKISQYNRDKQEFEDALEKKFGENWKLLSTESFGANYDLASEFNYLRKKIDQIQLEIGGTGTRVNKQEELYTYSGKLNHYLNTLLSIKYNSSSIEGLIDKLEAQKLLKQNWLKIFYRDYSDVIRETKYEDSSQITSRGLYLSAEKQFLTYKQPSKSYSSSVITSLDLYNISTTVEIGDRVLLTHPGLNMKVVESHYDIYLNDHTPSSTTIAMINENITDNILQDVDVVLQQQNFVRIKTDTYPQYLTDLFIDGKHYGWNGMQKILLAQPTRIAEKIDLRVTGITKDFRSNVVQLTVEEDTMYNTLIDRLLVILK